MLPRSEVSGDPGPMGVVKVFSTGRWRSHLCIPRRRCEGGETTFVVSPQRTLASLNPHRGAPEVSGDPGGGTPEGKAGMDNRMC